MPEIKRSPRRLRAVVPTVPAPDDIIWGEPPPPVRRGRTPSSANTAFASALQGRPGEWAVFRTQSNGKTAATVAQQIKTGKSRAFNPPRCFEAVARPNPADPSLVDIWVRYLGPSADRDSEAEVG